MIQTDSGSAYNSSISSSNWINWVDSDKKKNETEKASVLALILELCISRSMYLEGRDLESKFP